MEQFSNALYPEEGLTEEMMTLTRISQLGATAVLAGFGISGAFAQAQTSPVIMAAVDSRTLPADAGMLLPEAASATLPEAPSATLGLASPDPGQAGNVSSPDPHPHRNVAPKYTGIIPAGVASQPLSGSEKAVFGLKQAFSPFSLLSITVSAGYSHVADTAPHYGTNSTAFGKRFGAAAARSTVQTLATDAVFAPIFHDDPRYYELGRENPFLRRVIYAAERVVVTRSDAGRQRVNAPLLLGYAVAAGVNNAYYPDQDTGAKSSFESYASSLGGAVLGFEVDEFLDDALRISHLRHRR